MAKQDSLQGVEVQWSVDQPADNAEAVTPSDTVDLPHQARALYIGGAGDASLILASDATAVLFVALVAGSILPCRVRRVRVTGTTATSMVALY